MGTKRFHHFETHILDSDTFKKASSFGNYLLNICNQISVKYRTFISLSLSLHRPTAGTHSEEGMLRDSVRRTACWKSFGFLSSDRIKRKEISVCCHVDVQHRFLTSQLFHLVECICRPSTFRPQTHTGGKKKYIYIDQWREEKASRDDSDAPFVKAVSVVKQ